MKKILNPNQEDALAVIEHILKYEPMERLLLKLEPFDHQHLLDNIKWNNIENPSLPLLYFVKHSNVFEKSQNNFAELIKKRVKTIDLYYDNFNPSIIFIPLLEKALNMCLKDPQKTGLSHIANLTTQVVKDAQPSQWNDDLVKLINQVSIEHPPFLKSLGEKNVKRFQHHLKALPQEVSTNQKLLEKTNEAFKKAATAKENEKAKKKFKEEFALYIVGRSPSPKKLERFDLLTQEEKQDFLIEVLESHDWLNRLQKTNKLLGERLDGLYLPYESRIFDYLIKAPQKRVEPFYQLLLPSQKKSLWLHLVLNAQHSIFTPTEKALNNLLENDNIKAQNFPTFIPVCFTNQVLSQLKNKKAIQKASKKVAELEQKGLASSSLLGLIEGLCEINDVPSPLGASPKTYPKVAMGSPNVYDSYYFGRRKVFKPYNDWVSKKKLNQKIKKSLKSVKKLEETAPKPKRKM